MIPLLDRIRAGDFAGGEAFAKLPLRDGIANMVLESAVLPRVPALRAMRLVIHPQNRLDLVLSFRSRWLPAITVPLDLEPHVSMTPAPLVRLSVRDVGVIGRFGPLAGLMGDRLPTGIRVNGRTIEIDLVTLVGPYDPLGVLRFLRQAHLTTGPGVLWVEAAMGVPTASHAAETSEA